jgi:hypothetical protein
MPEHKWIQTLNDRFRATHDATHSLVLHCRHAHETSGHRETYEITQKMPHTLVLPLTQKHSRHLDTN